jgi:hypothetical protein
MDQNLSIRDILKSMSFSKALRELTLEEQAILKAAVIRKDEAITNFVVKILGEELAGRGVDTLKMKAMVDDYTGKNSDTGHLRDLKEAAARREEEQYLEGLLTEMEGQ